MVVVDAGHGGVDPGCRANGLVEKDLSLLIALSLRSLAEQVGLPFGLVRSTDESLRLSGRGKRASALKATQVINLHFDTNPDSSVGALTCYCRRDDQASERLAHRIMRLAPAVLSGSSKVVHVEPHGWTRRAYNVVQSFSSPALLVECGFLSNKNHATYLRSRFGISTLASTFFCALLSAQEETAC